MRRWLRLSLLICILTLLPTTAQAHPGRTDANGGHWNRSTGEYHYHHGYSAHDHYDMDGDGDVDCPYEFKDNTIEKDYIINFDNLPDVKEYDFTIATIPEYAYPSSKLPTETTPAETTSVKKEPAPVSLGWINLVIIAESFLIVWLIVLCFDKSKHIRKLRDMYFYDLAEIKKDYEARAKESQCRKEDLLWVKNNIKRSQDDWEKILQDLQRTKKEISNARITLLQTERETLIAKKKLENIRNAPLGISFADDGYPIYWDISLEKPYGDFTVYYNYKSKVYHTDSFCAPYFSEPTHLFKVIPNSRPCKKCALKYENYKIPEWFSNPDK